MNYSCYLCLYWHNCRVCEFMARNINEIYWKLLLFPFHSVTGAIYCFRCLECCGMISEGKWCVSDVTYIDSRYGDHGFDQRGGPPAGWTGKGLNWAGHAAMRSLQLKEGIRAQRTQESAGWQVSCVADLTFFFLSSY